MPDPREELGQLEKLLSDRVEPEPRSLQFMFESLQRRRDEVLASMSGEQFHLALSRTSPSTGAEAGFLADVLAELQASLASVAQALTTGATRGGAIPDHVKQAVELRVVAAQPGSLDLQLAPAYPTDQVQLFDDETAPPLLDASVERVVRVIGSAGEDRAQVLDEVAELGSRATSHLRELSKALATSHASALLEWTSPRASYRASVDWRGAATLEELLGEVTETATTQTFTGRLVGASLIHRRFALETGTGEVIDGSVDENAVRQIESFPLGDQVVAQIEVRHLSLSSDESKEAYRLLDLDHPN